MYGLYLKVIKKNQKMTTCKLTDWTSAREVSFWAYRVCQDPSDSKSNWLHVHIVWFSFHSFEVDSIDSSKMMGNSPELLTNRIICN